MTDHVADAESLVAQSPDAIIFAGTDGMIREWNAAAERIFGFSADEALGQSLDMIIPEGFRNAHWTNFDRALSEKATKYAGQSLPTRALTKAAGEIYVELSFAIVLGPAGEALGALATARDITERFNRDRELRRELRALKEAAKQA